MDLLQFADPHVFLHSEEAEEGARSLLSRTSSGELGMEILPSVSSQFHGEREEKDYLSYCRFLKSIYGQKLIHILEEDDAGELPEL